jgi:cell division GTPase FtsZ
MPNFTPKVVIGAGQCGTRLAAKFALDGDKLITFNTDSRDVGGEQLENDHIIVEGGAGQNYSRGLKIWSQHKNELENHLKDVEDEYVTYFISGGGGSGSSSVITILNILLQNRNKVLLVVALPFVKESIPATSNATRLMSRVAEFSNNMSVVLMSNDDISKQVGSHSFDKINDEIIRRTRLITDIINLHDDSYFTPFAVDEGDHASVAFSGGFINVSFDNLYEEVDGEYRAKSPKFSYGNIKEASNVLVVKNIQTNRNHPEAMREGDELVEVAMKVGNAAKGARTLYGTIRTDKNVTDYTTFVSGIGIDKVFNKLKAKATDSAIQYTEKVKTKTKKKLERSEDRTLDI